MKKGAITPQGSATSEIIYHAHQMREEIMQVITAADKEKGLQKNRQIMATFYSPELGILSRTVDPIRCLKNIMLSFNTLYSYSAEKGGLSPLTAHYKAEKYAIMIEKAESEQELWKIYEEYFMDYLDAENRSGTTLEGTISERVLDYIEKNFTNNLSIEEIARAMHLNPFYLMRCFKRQTGTTIQNTIIKKRVSEANRLLIQSNMSLTEISFMVGFNSPAYFSKVFKSEMGCSPKEYKKKSKKS